MAESDTQDPLDTLQLMLNEAVSAVSSSFSVFSSDLLYQLVQTGKALRAARLEGKGWQFKPPPGSPSSIPDTIRTFHSALDTMEGEIV